MSSIVSLGRRESFLVGDVGRIHVLFTLDGVATDPDVVRLYIKPPRSNTFQVGPGEVQSGDEGEYYYDQLLTLPGEWKWRWESSGVVSAAAQGEQWVDASNV